MTHHEHPNVALVREGFAAFARGDTAWMDQHLADDVVWHVGGNSRWAGAYQGKDKVLEYFARQAQAMAGPVSADIHDILGDDDHVVVLGSASATAADGSGAQWKYVQVFHIRDGKTTEVWGMAENDAAVDPFLDSLPD
jgi:ketosteroid isomerase-like protein